MFRSTFGSATPFVAPVVTPVIAAGAETIPDDVICYFDVIIALDLDCADFNENPVIGGFATQVGFQNVFIHFDWFRAPSKEHHFEIRN